VFFDPVLLPGREEVQRWAQAFATVPEPFQGRIRALVSDALRGIIGLALDRGRIPQLCHFHLISQLQGSRGRRKRRLANRREREAIYRLTRRALDLPDGPALRALCSSGSPISCANRSPPAGSEWPRASFSEDASIFAPIADTPNSTCRQPPGLSKRWATSSESSCAASETSVHPRRCGYGPPR
jgi:hypothetical protein